MTQKLLESASSKKKDRVKPVAKFIFWNDMCAFIRSRLFQIHTFAVATAIGLAVTICLTDYKTFFFYLSIQIDRTNDITLNHGEKHSLGIQDDKEPSEILHGSSTINYVDTGREAKHNLESRDHLSAQRSENLQLLSCSTKLKGSCGKVDKRHKLSFQEFHDSYDGKWPVIVRDVMSEWPAINWTAEFFKSNYGNSRVTMTTYSDSEQSGFSIPLKRFLDHLHMSSSNMWTYVQDELFLMQHPELKDDILKPIYTKGDLFQLLPPAVRPWDCMLLWGTAYSRSSLHIDPYNWTGTNAVISGLKRWKLLPPGQDHLLSVGSGRRCGFPLECVKYNSDLDLFAPSEQAKLSEIRYLEANQGPGEMLFIPPGWFHQAFNVAPTLAVSGQLMNSNNYRIILEEMFKGGSIKQSFMPNNFDIMAPQDAVAAIAAQIPHHVLEEGRRRTEQAIQQLYSHTPQP